jgi:hypothetical protein
VAAGTKLLLNVSYWWGQIRRSQWGQVELTKPDAAGREGAQRMDRAFRAAGRVPLRAELAEGEDPASWLALRGPTGLREVMGWMPRAVGRQSPAVETGLVPTWGASL